MARLQRFDEYMYDCLYAPLTGFYTSGKPTTGSRGSFVTSPTVGPLFGEVIANWVATLEGVNIVYDVGSNTGKLASAVASSAICLEQGWEVKTVDFTNADLTPQEFSELDLKNSVVIANELLDNLPFRVLRNHSDHWKERYVDISDERRPMSKWQRLDSTDIADLAPEVQKTLDSVTTHLTQVPVLDTANDWVKHVLEKNPISLLCIDYGARYTIDLVTRGDWLRTYTNQVVDTNDLAEPGDTDITCDVPFDQLPEAKSYATQAEFLAVNGLSQLVATGEEYWAENSRAPDVKALKMKSRNAEAQQLLDPKGLGTWLVAQWL